MTVSTNNTDIVVLSFLSNKMSAKCQVIAYASLVSFCNLIKYVSEYITLLSRSFIILTQFSNKALDLG